MAHGHSASREEPAISHPTFNNPSDHRSLLNNPAFLQKTESPALRSNSRIWAFALVVSALVFGFALGLQWIVYDRYLHENGIRIVGSAIAAAVSVLLVLVLETSARNQRLREIKRLETIALLNHHIRNALQAIVSSSGSTNSTDTIRTSVERIEWALGEVLPDLQRPRNRRPNSDHD